MSSIAEEKRVPQTTNGCTTGELRRETKRHMSTQQGVLDADRTAKCIGDEQHARKRLHYQSEPRSHVSKVGEGSTSETRAEVESREIEIQEHVFSISLPGVEITHCNFGKSKVEVWYTATKTEIDEVTIKEELQRKIESHVEPYTLKLVKNACLPTFKYTSPGQSTSLMRAAGSIGAYITLKETDESVLHALVSGHGKVPGDTIHFDQNPVQAIGTVKVAKVQTLERRIASGRSDYKLTNSVDVGLVEMVEQELDNHKAFVTTNEFGRVKLARAEANIHPTELKDDEKVMLFNNDNRQGIVYSRNHNNRISQKFGMIAIAQQPGENRRAVHSMNESGTLIVSYPPYKENGANLVKAVGMLVGIEEYAEPPGSISLAVPIGTNLQELKEDDYCANKDIQFAQN